MVGGNPVSTLIMGGVTVNVEEGLILIGESRCTEVLGLTSGVSYHDGT